MDRSLSGTKERVARQAGDLGDVVFQEQDLNVLKLTLATSFSLELRNNERHLFLLEFDESLCAVLLDQDHSMDQVFYHSNRLLTGAYEY